LSVKSLPTEGRLSVKILLENRIYPETIKKAVEVKRLRRFFALKHL
jgi:hypothetical protein